MTTFYICRHRQTGNNRDGRFSGWQDTPLTAVGIQDAKTVAMKSQGIHFDLLLASDLGRTVATADIIAHGIGFNGEISKLAGLREINYGDISGQPYSVYPLRLTALENAELQHPQGESLRQMQARVLDSLWDIATEYLSATILIVAHDGTINAIRASFWNENIGIIDAENANPHDIVVEFIANSGTVTSLKEFAG